MLRSLARCRLALALALATPALAALPSAALAQQPTTETIVLLRHGEKPPQGLGQLDCRGLNRALALPAVLGKLFGKPDVIFAPDPGQTKLDDGHPYNYIRPLATIEPTAIAFALPVDTSLGEADIASLQRRLEAPALHGSLVLVAWEHTEIVALARTLMTAHGGDPASIPHWRGSDFDSIDVLRITWTDHSSSIQFMPQHENLDSQPTTCPGRPPG